MELWAPTKKSLAGLEEAHLFSGFTIHLNRRGSDQIDVQYEIYLEILVSLSENESLLMVNVTKRGGNPNPKVYQLIQLMQVTVPPFANAFDLHVRRSLLFCVLS